MRSMSCPQSLCRMGLPLISCIAAVLLMLPVDIERETSKKGGAERACEEVLLACVGEVLRVACLVMVAHRRKARDSGQSFDWIIW